MDSKSSTCTVPYVKSQNQQNRTNKTKCSQRKSPPPPPPRHHNTDPFNIKNVVRVRWSDGVQCTRVSTGQLSRSHSQYYTASLLMREATTQMSVRLVNSDDRQQHARFLRHKMCSVWGERPCWEEIRAWG